MAAAQRATVHGGLKIVKMPKVQWSDADYVLISSSFNANRVPATLMAAAKETLELLNQKEPPGLLVYAKKQKAYNRLLMLNEQLTGLANNTGPHTVKQCSRSRNGISIYSIQLSSEYCERNSKDIKASRVIILEPYQQEMRRPYQQYNKCLYKGNLIFFAEDEKQTFHFVPLFRTMPEGNYMARFLPPQFVYNARNSILSELIDNQKLYRFLVFPPPIDAKLSVEQYLELRALALSKCQFSSGRFNAEQREAIVAIVYGRQLKVTSQRNNILPFILHGPPGTGKTTTLVEACLMLVTQFDTGRILVCTPSNTAADLFAHELTQVAGVNPRAVFRMYALTHPTSELHDTLKDIAFVMPNNEEMDQFGIPPLKKLLEYRIVICTLLCSIYLFLGGMKGQFSHIIIDEAGQASELDTLVPIVGLLGAHDTKIVLAGDPRQLGPVEMVDYFQKIGISSSLIERYESNPNYKNDPRIVTMLRANYRSHASIIALPSRLFYNNELYVPEDAPPRDALATWKRLPKQGFPILWHHVNEPEEKEMDGHSFANKGEQDIVYDYIKKVCSELHVKPSDIGVIAPYNYQVRRLRLKLSKEHKEVTVGTVERFQGSQRRVIIVTTVRNNEKEAIGFLMSDKRFNTMITRAEELLIIVGNAKVMMRDPSWKEMVDYCRKNNAIVEKEKEEKEENEEKKGNEKEKKEEKKGKEEEKAENEEKEEKKEDEKNEVKEEEEKKEKPEKKEEEKEKKEEKGKEKQERKEGKKEKGNEKEKKEEKEGKEDKKANENKEKEEEKEGEEKNEEKEEENEGKEEENEKREEDNIGGSSECEENEEKKEEKKGEEEEKAENEEKDDEEAPDSEWRKGNEKEKEEDKEKEDEKKEDEEVPDSDNWSTDSGEDAEEVSENDNWSSDQQEENEKNEEENEEKEEEEKEEEEKEEKENEKEEEEEKEKKEEDNEGKKEHEEKEEENQKREEENIGGSSEEDEVVSDSEWSTESTWSSEDEVNEKREKENIGGSREDEEEISDNWSSDTSDEVSDSDNWRSAADEQDEEV